MPRFNVEYNGRWACFSSITDSFITTFAEKEGYEAWRKIEYGLHDYVVAEKRNVMSMEEAVFSIRLNRSHEQALETLLQTELPKEECEKLLYDTETEHYCPKKNVLEEYICPNCHNKIKEGQVSCEEDLCGREFIWREG